MNIENKINEIVGSFCPVEYPEFYSREQMEEAVRKALKYQEKRIKDLEDQVRDAGWRYEYDHADDWRKPTEMGQL
jgi:hypothetical protein